MPQDHIIGEGGVAGGTSARSQTDINEELARLDLINAELRTEDDDIHADLPRGTKPASPAPSAEQAAEELASRKGWVSKATWIAKGKPASQWTDAVTFNKRGDAFVTNLQAELAAVKAKLERFEGTAAEFEKFQKTQAVKQDSDSQAALRQLRLQHKEAIRNGEDEEALELEDQIDALKASTKAAVAEIKAAPAPPPAPQDSLLLDEWIEDGNSWFKENDKLRTYAVALGDKLIQGGETLRGRKFLDMIAEKMREEFPRSFRTTAAPAASGRVSGGGNGGAGSSGAFSINGRTARDLPASDRALMRQFIEDGLYTEETFLKSYFTRN